MKKIAATQAQAVFQSFDNLIESVGRERNGFKQQKREMADNVARALAGKDRVSFDFGEDFLRIVMKNELQQIRKSAAIRGLRAEERSGAFAPGKLFGRGIAEEPALFAENFSHFTARESVRARGCTRRVVVLRRHDQRRS